MPPLSAPPPLTKQPPATAAPTPHSRARVWQNRGTYASQPGPASSFVQIVPALTEQQPLTAPSLHGPPVPAAPTPPSGVRLGKHREAFGPRYFTPSSFTTASPLLPQRTEQEFSPVPSREGQQVAAPPTLFPAEAASGATGVRSTEEEVLEWLRRGYLEKSIDRESIDAMIDFHR